MQKFKCLYYFTSPELDVLEIKRLDQPKDALISDIYKWLIVIGKTEEVLELGFKSMNKNEFEELRDFVEGKFKFNDEHGTLVYLAKSFQLLRADQNNVPDDRLELVSKHLK